MENLEKQYMLSNTRNQIYAAIVGKSFALNYFNVNL